MLYVNCSSKTFCGTSRIAQGIFKRLDGLSMYGPSNEKQFIGILGDSIGTGTIYKIQLQIIFSHIESYDLCIEKV
jgi:hypothetical protein